MPKVRFELDDGSSIDQDLDDEVFGIMQSNPRYAAVLRDKLQEEHYFNRQIDYTPFKVEDRFKGMPGKIREESGAMSKDELKRRNMLAASGITVGSGPFNKAEIAYFQSLAKDSPYEFAEFFIPKVKDKIDPTGTNDPRRLVKVGEDGRVRFLDLKTKDNPAGTNRWTEFEGLPIDPFNALEIGLDTAGAFSGEKLAQKLALKPFRNAAMQATGSAAGATDAELMRQALAKYHGITDPSGGEMALSAAKRGGIAGAGSMIGAGIGRGIQNFASTPNPYFFNPDTAKNFEKSAAQGSAIRQRVREIPGGEDFNPDLAQLSGEESLLTLRATLEKNLGGSSEMKTAAGILTKDQSNNRILANVLGDLLSTERKVTGQEVGEAIKGVNLKTIEAMPPSAQKQQLLKLYAENEKKKAALGPIREIAEQGRATIISRLRGAPQVATEGGLIGQEATGLNKILQGYKDAEQKAWGEYERVYDNVEKNLGQPLNVRIGGNNDPRFNVMNNLNGFIRKADATWFQGARARYKPIYELRDIAQANDGQVSLFALNSNLSDLKETLRIMKRNPQADGPNVGMVEAMVSELQKVRDGYVMDVLRNPVLMDNLLKAEATTKAVHDFTKRSVASKMLVKDGVSGAYKIRNPDSTMEDIMIPGSDEGMKQWMDIIGDDKDLVQATKDWYGQHYYNSVLRNGLADPQAHAEWIRQYGAQASLLFGADMKNITRLGYIGKAVQEGEAKLKNLEFLVKQSSAGKIDRMDPEQIVTAILGARSRLGGASAVQSRLSLSNTAGVMQVLKRESPETVELLQDRAREMIRMSMFGDEATASTSRALSSKTLGKFLEESQSQRLSMVMGPQFVADLKALKNGMEVMERSSNAMPIPMNTPGLNVFRVIFGPLSRVQRTITAGRKWSIVGQEQKLADIISDPAKLREVMRKANLPAQSPTGMALLTSLGLLEATN